MGGAVNVTNSNFINNSADLAGAIYVNDLIVSNSYFSQNHAKSAGAVYGDSLIVDNCRFINNYAKSNEKFEGKGGAINIGASKSVIKNSKFIGNVARNGGALSIDETDNLKIEKCEFKSNSASENGGTIYYPGYIDRAGVYYAKISFLNSIIDGSNAKTGSVIFASYADLTINNITINNVGNDVVDLYHFVGKSNIKNTNFTNIYYIKLLPIKISPTKLSTSYGSGKTLTFKAVDKFNNKGLDETIFIVKVATGKEYKKFWVETDSKGVGKVDLTYDLSLGSHKIEIIPYSSMAFDVKKATSSIKISKAKTTVKAPKVIVKFKKSKYFKVTVKNKESKKAMKNIKVKVKVYTANKFKTYDLKTNKRGIAQLNTKKLAKGTHKVIITSGNPKCKISAKSSIVVK